MRQLVRSDNCDNLSERVRSLRTAGGRLLGLHRGRLVLAGDGLLRLVPLQGEEEEMVETEGDIAAVAEAGAGPHLVTASASCVSLLGPCDNAGAWQLRPRARLPHRLAALHTNNTVVAVLDCRNTVHLFDWRGNNNHDIIQMVLTLLRSAGPRPRPGVPLHLAAPPLPLVPLLLALPGPHPRLPGGRQHGLQHAA